MKQTVNKKTQAPPFGMPIPGMSNGPGDPKSGALSFMIVTIPPKLQSFCADFCDFVSESKRAGLALLLAGYLLPGGKRTQSAVGRAVLTGERSPGSVSRRMRRKSFGTRDLVRHRMKSQVAQELKRARGKEETWFLSIDGLCSKRGSKTKVENAIQYKRKKRGKKGRSTKAHVFVMGILITPSGARIALPRRSFYTKEYLKAENNRRKAEDVVRNLLVHKTQVDRACLIVKELELPENIRLVVVADEYFKGTKLTNLCRKKGYIYIVPANSRRNFESGGKLHAKGKALPRSAYRELILRRGEEDTASHRRHLPGRAGEKGRRVYRFHYERRAVAGIGEVGVVYSWKGRRNRSGRLTSRETYKVLVCSDPRIAGKHIIEWFEMRWAVEVYFRELKSDLGFSDYQGMDFKAFERHVDLVLLSFMLLEEMRLAEMAKTRSPVRRRELASLRTSGMLRRFEREAHANDLNMITEILELHRGFSQGRGLLQGRRMSA